MSKNGLALMSIGLLIFVYATNQNTGIYDFLSMTTAIFFFGLGVYLFVKASRREKARKEAERLKNPHGIKKGEA